jgi:hypothetical protein
MANAEKGEVVFMHGEKQYTLVVNTMALAKMQRLFNTKDDDGKDVIAEIAELDRLVKSNSLEHIIGYFWAALQKYHPEIVTTEQAAELIDAAGAEAAAALMETMGLGKVDSRDLEELAKASGNPPKAQAKGRRRRGGIYTSMRAATA